jgi:uncharacterized protein
VLAQHAQNASVFEAARTVEFRDDLFGPVSCDALSPLLGARSTTRSAAIQRVAGWLDSGTTRGALSDYLTLATPYHVLIIAPETHTGNFRCDPYDFGEPPRLDDGDVARNVWRSPEFLDTFLGPEATGDAQHLVRYYTYVERKWKETATWPPVGFAVERWYFAADRALSRAAPQDDVGEDVYTVDFEATTGLENRWFSGMNGAPIRYPDRATQDQRLLVYDSPPFEQDYELTGHPVVNLWVSSTQSDGAFFVYLEDVSPEGKVVYLTEGELRAIHRRVSEEQPPVALFGPNHTFERAAAMPMIAGEVAEIAFDLLPISTIIRAGHHIRVAIAGHDADTFVRHPAEGTPVLKFQRNAAAACYIDLPLRPRDDLGWMTDDPPVVGAWEFWQ